MKFEDYQALVRALPFGKRLPNAIYLLRCPGQSLAGNLSKLVDKVATGLEVEDGWGLGIQGRSGRSDGDGGRDARADGEG